MACHLDDGSRRREARTLGWQLTAYKPFERNVVLLNELEQVVSARRRLIGFDFPIGPYRALENNGGLFLRNAERHPGKLKARAEEREASTVRAAARRLPAAVMAHPFLGCACEYTGQTLSFWLLS